MPCASLLPTGRHTLPGAFSTRPPALPRLSATRLDIQAVQKFTGKVVSTAPAKTAVVAVDRWRQHPVYKKRLKSTKKYMAHDEEESTKVGDVVQIMACRPLSARKRFTVTKVVTPAKEPKEE